MHLIWIVLYQVSAHLLNYRHFLVTIKSVHLRQAEQRNTLTLFCQPHNNVPRMIILTIHISECIRGRITCIADICKNIVNVRNQVTMPVMRKELHIISFIKRVECNSSGNAKEMTEAVSQSHRETVTCTGVCWWGEIMHDWTACLSMDFFVNPFYNTGYHKDYIIHVDDDKKENVINQNVNQILNDTCCTLI